MFERGTVQTEAVRPVMQELHARGIPVVPISVMTLDELAPIAADLGWRRAMIIEAGGAIARWAGSGWEVEAFGPPAEILLDVIREIEDRSGANLLVYSALPEREALRLSGCPDATDQKTRPRHFSEPFVMESGDLDAICKAANDLGFSVRRGQRFHYLCRQVDRGEAFLRLRDELQCDTTIGIGGSMVDAEFLTLVDLPVIVPGRDGAADAELRASVPRARIAPGPAPGGWAAAINDALQGLASRRRRTRPAAS